MKNLTMSKPTSETDEAEAGASLPARVPYRSTRTVPKPSSPLAKTILAVFSHPLAGVLGWLLFVGVFVYLHNLWGMSRSMHP